ncbi:MAG TPA: thiamine-phosphate kinase [Pseudomonadales bacterium]|nr:thiamine-phosphate kinase [Pseudomonadales bacterium]
MALGEFDLIQRYFAELTAEVNYSALQLGIGDDCALIAQNSAEWLAVSTDTLVAGVHFPEQTPPADIGWKALAVNLSDLAAMGATPSWFTLAITLPEVNEAWLRLFCEGMAALVRRHPIKLVGGDTTRGPLSMTLTVAGHLPKGSALRRSGAQPGDSIFVSGCLGDAGRGLQLWQTDNASHPVEQALIQRLTRPQPRLALGKALLSLANSCIDISDGLLGDLQHICDQSQLCAQVDAQLLPFSEELLNDVSRDDAIKLALTAGDDYELCFTAPTEKTAQILRLKETLGINICKIGEMQPCASSQQAGVTVINAALSGADQAFQHFRTTP